MRDGKAKRSKAQARQPVPDGYCSRSSGTDKKGYRSRSKALKVVRLHRSKDGRKLYVYECPRCALWHLTSQRPNEGTG